MKYEVTVQIEAIYSIDADSESEADSLAYNLADSDASRSAESCSVTTMQIWGEA